MTDQQKIDLLTKVIALLSSAVGLPIVLIWLIRKLMAEYFTLVNRFRDEYFTLVGRYLTDYNESVKNYRDETTAVRLQSQIINANREPLGRGLT